MSLACMAIKTAAAPIAALGIVVIVQHRIHGCDSRLCAAAHGLDFSARDAWCLVMAAGGGLQG